MSAANHTSTSSARPSRCSHASERPRALRRRCPAGLPPARQADRRAVQPGLRLLLLPVKGEALYPDSRFRMSDEQLEAYLRQLIESHSQAPEVTIAWQGGEPTLMGLDFFRRSVEIAQRYLQPGQRA